jgi:hypothetical protein
MSYTKKKKLDRYPPKKIIKNPNQTQTILQKQKKLNPNPNQTKIKLNLTDYFDSNPFPKNTNTESNRIYK